MITIAVIGLFLATLNIGQLSGAALSHRESAEFLTGQKLRAELDQPAGGAWVNVELRALLRQLADQRRTAIVLDRRIDPTILLPTDISNRSLREGYQQIANQVSAEASFLESVVYFGPPQAAGRLRTIVEVKNHELQSKTVPISDTRRAEILKRQNISWDDLDSPEVILQMIADKWRLTLVREDRVPHDLWAGFTIPKVTGVEALSIVLIQFDLTFKWVDGGQAIELIPLPKSVLIERKSRIKGRTPAEAMKFVNEHLPTLKVSIDGADLVVQGTVEDHEAVAALFNSSGPKRATSQKSVPLRQRTFAEIRFSRIPVSDVMNYLEKQQIRFDFDPEELKVAGIDLGREIDVELKKATAQELFQAIFGPLKLKVEIDNITVRLTPAN